MKVRTASLGFLVAAVALAVAALSFTGFSRSALAPPEIPAARVEQTAHLPFGHVNPPRPMPDITMVLADGAEQQLGRVLAGRWTLVQLMFTGCSTTCPVQGAIFAETQQRLKASGADVGLLSLSIDPLGDTPTALAGWLKDFGAASNWTAGLTAPDTLVEVLDVLEGRGAGVDVHNARVFIIDPNGMLVYRTEEMPDPGSLVRLIEQAIAASRTPA